MKLKREERDSRVGYAVLHEVCLQSFLLYFYCQIERVGISNDARVCYPQKKIWTPPADPHHIFLRTHDCTQLARTAARPSKSPLIVEKELVINAAYFMHGNQINSVVEPHRLRRD
jgi:hypothetical protein